MNSFVADTQALVKFMMGRRLSMTLPQAFLDADQGGNVIICHYPGHSVNERGGIGLRPHLSQFQELDRLDTEVRGKGRFLLEAILTQQQGEQIAAKPGARH